MSPPGPSVQGKQRLRLLPLSRWCTFCRQILGKQASLICLFCFAVFITYIMMSSLQAGNPSHPSLTDSGSDPLILQQSRKAPPPPQQPPQPPLSSSSSSASSSAAASAAASSGNGQQQLLLVTYGRSGSSFTSELVSRDRSVFYAFEPLYILQKWRNMNHGNDATSNDTATSLKIMRSFLTCNFTALDSTYLDNFQLRLSGPEMKDFFECTKSPSQGIRHINCYLKMIQECRGKKNNFAKVIRFPMQWASELMSVMPNLKILYLVRDPRAVLRSQAAVFKTFKWPEDVEMRARLHCKLMDEDLAAIDKLSASFPGRVRPIRYETGAIDPVGYTKDIYKFAGLPFTNDTMAHIKAVTKASGSKTDLLNPYSLVKSNAVEAANHWRSKVTFKSVKMVDSACVKVYTRYGYRKARSTAHLHSKENLFDLTFNQLL